MTRFCTCSGSVGYTRGLNIKRNLLAQASCKTCGGRFLVDGIKPVSESMFGTVAPEVMNFINPELNWKTVTKGRRSKKSGARSLKGVAEVGNRSPKRVGNFSGSDSDKFGEAGLGQRSSGELEHVPIKKRRHLLRSPSPNPRVLSLRGWDSSSPQTRISSPISEDLEQLSDQNHSSGYWSLNSYSNQLSRDFDGSETVKGVDHVIFPDGPDAVLYSSDDFSGIALLAAAACINSMDDVDIANKEDLVLEDSSIPECSVASTCPTELKVGLTCAESGNSLSKELVHADSIQCTIVTDNAAAASLSILESVKDGAVQRSVSSKVDRLHWDLNTVMETWDEPYTDSVVGNASKDINDVGILGGKLDRECCAVHKDCDFKCAGLEFSNLKKEENNSEELSDSDGTFFEKKCSPTPERCLLEPVNSYADMGTCCESMRIDSDKSNSAQVVSRNSDVDTSIQIVDKEAIPNNLNLTELPCSSCSESEKKKNETSGNIDILQGEYCCSNMIEYDKTTSETVEAGIENSTSHKVPILGLSTSVNYTEDSRETSEQPDIRISLRETMISISCKRPDIDNSGSNLSEADFSHLSCNCGNFPSSGSFIHDGQSVAIAEGKGGDDSVSVAGSIIFDSHRHFKSKEIVAKHENDYVSNEGQMRPISQDLCNGGGENVDCNAPDVKIGVLDDCQDSDVSQDNQGQMVDGDEVTKFQAGYDSPYEDGELRGSVLYSWEDNEVEDGENERVDYDSDGRNGDNSDAADYPGSDIVDGGSEGSVGAKKKLLLARRFSETDLSKGGSVKHYLRRHFTNNDTEKVMSRKREPNAGSGTTIDQSIDMVVEGDDDSERRRHMVDQTDTVDGKGLCMEEFGSRTSQGKLQSRIEGLSSSVVPDGNDVFVHQCRSRRIGGSYSRPERDSSSEKYPVRYRPASHVYERDGCDSQWTYWGSRNHYTSRYHGLECHGHTRPRTAINDSTNKYSGFESHDQRQSANYSSRGLHRPSVRRSPVDRDDCFDIHRRMPLARGTCNNSRGGHSGTYFHELVPDDASRLPHYLSRRENSLSANPGRGSHISLAHGKSCSRSRSRSPRPWNLHRERNPITRRYSRSPDFRSDARKERMRLPFSKPSFASDFGEGYMSPPRGGCFSPQRNCRWVGDRNSMDNHRLRHRRSPVRIFKRNERFDTVGSSGRMKDDSFRPTMRPGRFSFMANGDKGCRFEAGFEDRIHRVRLSDDDGSIRRFPLDVTNNFDASNSNNEDDVRGTDRRDVPRSARDSKRSFNTYD